MIVISLVVLFGLKFIIEEVVWLRKETGDRYLWQIGIGGASTAVVVYTAWVKTMEWMAFYRRRLTLREEMRRHWAEE